MNLESKEALLLQTFNSVLEADLKTSEIDAQAFCSLFRHLERRVCSSIFSATAAQGNSKGKNSS